MKARSARISLRDRSALTPQESMIYEMRKSGMSNSEIAEKLGNKWTDKNVSSRMKVIKEKLECQ